MATDTSMSAGSTVPANAEAPIWQPWVSTQNRALSAFKTDIGRALASYNAQMSDAQKLLTAAEAAASGTTATLQAAAVAAYEQYMAQADRLYNAVMAPALRAYETAAKAAHTKLWERLGPSENAYAQVAADAIWTKSLATGGAKLGTEPPLPGQ